MKTEGLLYRAIVGLLLLSSRVHGFVERRIVKFLPSTNNRPLLIRLRVEPEQQQPNIFQKIMDPYPTKIPLELKEEIYKAESNTPVAQERSQRVLLYGIIGVVLVSCAFTNGFLTELRSAAKAAGDIMTPADFGFGWVETNILFRFIFLNGIGGAMALFGGAASGMMAEAELDSRRQNAEKIYEELVRRRDEKERSLQKGKASAMEPSKKKQSATQKKRMAALSELVIEENISSTAVEEKTTGMTQDIIPEVKQKGILDKLKSFYEQADSMAASQALLLNKELEDRGVIEKITDESGLKVIGRDAAAKRGEENKESEGIQPTLDKGA